ncbi:MAG: alpha/beta fold hydrolase [Dictyoglomaceae bacterium]|nr:alpha/beta fold hydrolase [Dictyoglomaceae bacterium]
MRKLIIFLLTLSLVLDLGFSQQEERILSQNFVNLLSQGKFNEAINYFDDSVKPLLPGEKLKEIWESLIKQVGEFKGIINIRDEKSGVYSIVYVTSEFFLMDIDVKLVFLNKKLVGLFFQPAPPRKGYIPPYYVDLSSFEEKDVKVGKSFDLPGKLVIPKGDKKYPIIIFVHGSGPNDMDETIGPNKPFRDLAYGLGTLGIASLRYDKRTKVYPEEYTKFKEGFTVMEEVIEDVLYAIDFVKKEEKIDKNKIFILGHSLGGMLAGRIASLSKDVSGLIIMAGPTRPLEDLIWDQINYIFNLDGILTDEEKFQLSAIKLEIDKIKDPNLEQKYPPSLNILNAPVKYWADLKKYDPVNILSSLNIPVLILQGERDYQVTLEDFEGWKRLSNKENIRLKLYPQLNHLFMEGEGKSTPDEYYREGHIPEYVIKDISNWIKKEI